jgi:autotransporter strand-loop-strand O-heptosyltransferase
MKTILIELYSYSLGDTIAIMPCVEDFVSKTEDNVLLKVNPRFHSLFTNSYPTVKFYQTDDTFDKKINLHFNFNLPLQTGFAHQLGFMDWKYVRPKVDIVVNERPIKSKYITISIHSTSQLKYWNHPAGVKSQPMSPYWTELNGLLRKAGYTPVVVEKSEKFGRPPYFNGMPSKSNNKFGVNLEDTINYIYHSEFFIGLSSGLSWLAHAMGKKVVMISNFSDENHEFDLSIEDYKRITNKSVCHNCWGLVNKEIKFDSEDWYWCPKHRDTPRQFECHTSITPDYVFEQLKDWLD